MSESITIPQYSRFLTNYNEKLPSSLHFDAACIVQATEDVTEKELMEASYKLFQDALSLEGIGSVFRYNACRLVLKLSQMRERKKDGTHTLTHIIEELELPERTGLSWKTWCNYLGWVSQVPEEVFVPGVTWGNFSRVAQLPGPRNPDDWPMFRASQRRALQRLAAERDTSESHCWHIIKEEIRDKVELDSDKVAPGSGPSKRIIPLLNDLARVARRLVIWEAQDAPWLALGYDSQEQARAILMDHYTDLEAQLINLEALKPDPFDDVLPWETKNPLPD